MKIVNGFIINPIVFGCALNILLVINGVGQ